MPEALDQLADYYITLSVTEQRALEGRIERIEARLVENAGLLGESRYPPNRRIWFVGPFGLTFEVVLGGEIRILELVTLRRPTGDL